MNNHYCADEKISCFMDGESECPEDIAVTDQSRQCWQRYHLIREILRDTHTTPLSPQFNERITEFLNSAPPMLVPTKLATPTRSVTRQWFKPLAGFAMAATLGAIAVLLVPSNESLSPTPAATTTVAERMDTSPTVHVQATANNAVVNQALMSATLEESADPTVSPAAANTIDDSLDMYLIDHMEQSTTGQMQGVLPYVRLIGYDQQQ